MHAASIMAHALNQHPLYLQILSNALLIVGFCISAGCSPPHLLMHPCHCLIVTAEQRHLLGLAHEGYKAVVGKHVDVGHPWHVVGVHQFLAPANVPCGD